MKKIEGKNFPAQGTLLGKTIEVNFKDDILNYIKGVCVRDDIVQPFRTIFHLENGMFILSTECFNYRIDIEEHIEN